MKKYYQLFCFLACFLFFEEKTKAQVIINEFSCSNVSTLLDNYNEYEDWIEIHNPTGSPFNLTGFYLSDDATQPMKWQVPNGISINAGGYAIFFASGRNIVVGSSYHTSFKLVQSSQTEEIILADPTGVILDSITIRPTQANHSIGKSPNASTTWGIYDTPTPGAANGASSFSSYAGNVQFNLPAGFYGGSQNLNLSTTFPNAIIRYTVDGSEPSATSTQFSAPISIAATTLVRARVYSTTAGVLPGFIESNTYFINVNHTMPVVSVGSGQYTALFNSSIFEIRTCLEYFDVNQQLKFESYGTADPHGNDSWAYPQKGIDFVVRDNLGYDDQINYQIFQRKPRQKFQRIMFKAGASDNYPFTGAPGGGCHIRDHFIQSLSANAGLDCDYRTGENVILFINGQYWGLYEIREKVNDPDFTDFYHNQEEEDLDFLSFWGGLNIRYGSNLDWNNLYAFIMANNLADPVIYNQVITRIDVQSAIDYMIINTFSVNSDWINWNTMWWRGTGTPAAPWRYALWDMDNTFNLGQNFSGWPTTNYTADPCDLNAQFQNAGPNMGHLDVFSKLMDNPDFKDAFVNRWSEMLNTYLDCSYVINHLDSMVNVLTPEMPGQIARWGGSMATWQAHLTFLRSQINGRCSVINQGIIDCYQVTGPFELTFNVDPPLSGNIQFNNQFIPTYPFSGDYFGNVNGTLQATPVTGYNFWYWEVFNHTLTPDTVSVLTQFMIQNADSIVAHFKEIITHTVTYVVQPQGSGQVIINGFGYPNYPQVITYNDSASVTCAAVPYTGYNFLKYETNHHTLLPNNLDSLVNFQVLFSDTVIAYFEPEFEPTLTVIVTPPGVGGVNIDGYEPFSFPFDKQVPVGTTVNLSAVEFTTGKFEFEKWVSYNQPLNPDTLAKEVSIVLVQNDTIIAHFKQKEEIIPVVFVPGSFSPNDDGLNDVFKVFHSENITIGTVTIYDRWGQKVAFLSGLDQTWDGRDASGAISQGIYPFIVDYLNENGFESQFIGDVSIIR
jgi:gliding motility-associated-like protein